MIRVLATALVLTGCTTDSFFVRRGGADLPVWVRGPADAPLTVVVQHGSGTSGKVYDWMPAFEQIEGAARVVYWDQRGAGISQGAPRTPSLTLAESTADLDLVLHALREQLDPGRIVLLGHSLGGGISMAYLSENSVGSDIVGYVDVAGARSLREAYDDASAEIVAWAQERSTSPEDHFAEIVAFYEARPRFPREEPGRSQHASYVDELLAERGYDQPASTAAMTSFLSSRGVRDAWVGSFDPLAFLANSQRVIRDYDLDGVDVSPDDVASIDVPTLVLAGAFDLAVPVSVSRRTHEAIASDGDESPFQVLDASGHFPMWDEPDRFASAVLEFLQTL